jgi:hypothetical protein
MTDQIERIQPITVWDYAKSKMETTKGEVTYYQWLLVEKQRIAESGTPCRIVRNKKNMYALAPSEYKEE